MLVTLEGLDGSGKSTACRHLREWFQSAVFTREPTTSWYGDAVRRSVDDSDADPVAELFLYCADHAAHLSETIIPALDDDRLVISDRYVDSRIAYQGVTLRDRIDDPARFVRELHEPFTVMPDLTCFIEVDIPTAVQRSGGATKFERRPFLEAVATEYDRIIDAEPQRFTIIDGEQGIDGVVTDLVEVIQAHHP